MDKSTPRLRISPRLDVGLLVEPMYPGMTWVISKSLVVRW